MTTLEEEKHEESFDEGMGNILADSPRCNICNHSFTDTADFVNHVKLHFGGPGKTSSNKRKAGDEIQEAAPPAQKRQSPNRLTTALANERQQQAMPKMLSSHQQRSPVNSNDQMIAFSAQEEPEEDGGRQQGGQRSKGISSYHQSADLLSPVRNIGLQHARREESTQSKVTTMKSPTTACPPPMAGNLLELFTNQQILQQQQQQQQQLQAAAHFNSFNPFLPQYNPHQQQAAFPPPAYPFGFLPQPSPTFKCPWCPAVFDNREVMVHHMQLHQLPQNNHQNLYAGGNTNNHQEQSQRLRSSPPASASCGANCSCPGCTQARARRTKKVVEDIDAATLKKVEKLEWERKHGYWCKKCNKRFPTQIKLVDHMSSPEHNNPKTGRPSSAADSPTGSNQSSPSPTPSL